MKYEDFEVGKDYLLEGDKMTLVTKIRGDKHFRLRFENSDESRIFYFQRGLNINEFEFAEPKFEVGKVYKGMLKNDKYIIFLCTKITEKALYGYGFTENKWFDYQKEKNLYCACNNSHWERLTEATEKEWKQLLIEEAERRGYVKGVKAKCLSDGKVYTLDGRLGMNTYGLNRFWLSTTDSDDAKVMYKGRWAEIIENKNEVPTPKECNKVLDWYADKGLVLCLKEDVEDKENLIKDLKKLIVKYEK